MPIWKFSSDLAFFESIDDTALDLSLVACDLKDILSWLELTDGLVLIDALTRLQAAATVLDDATLDIGAFYRELQNIASYLQAAAESALDAKTDFLALGRAFEDLVTHFEMAKWTTVDIRSFLEVVRSTVLMDLLIQLEVVGGTVLSDIAVSLLIAKPTEYLFQSSVYHRMSSVVTKIL